MFGSNYFGQPYYGESYTLIITVTDLSRRTIDIPVTVIKHQSLTGNKLSGYVSALVDDPVYLVDDPSILVGSQSTIFEGIRPRMVRIKQESFI